MEVVGYYVTERVNGINVVSHRYKAMYGIGRLSAAMVQTTFFSVPARRFTMINPIPHPVTLY